MDRLAKVISFAGNGGWPETGGNASVFDLQMLLSKVQGYATAFAGTLQDIPRS
jgi:hypothetical protein